MLGIPPAAAREVRRSRLQREVAAPEVAVHPALRSGILDDFPAMALDEGLVVEAVDIIDVDQRPVLLVGYVDERYTGRRSGAWWDLTKHDERLEDPSALSSFHTYARTWLEELFHAGPPVDVRPADASGLAWSEIATLEPASPPHLHR